MTTRANTGVLRMAKQSAKGSAVADSSSVFGLNMAGTNLPRIMREQAKFEEADGNRMRSAEYVASVQGGGDAESYAMPGTLGFLLYCALGAVSTTGSGDPYTHTITVGTRPWVTLWPEWGLAHEKLVDGRLSKLVLSGKTKEPLRAVASWNSIGPQYNSYARVQNGRGVGVGLFPGHVARGLECGVM